MVKTKKTKKTNNNTLKRLLAGMIAVSAVTLAIVFAVVVLAFVLILGFYSAVIVNTVASAFIIIAIVEMVCDIGLIVLISISIACVARKKSPYAKAYIIIFAILLGLFVIFWVIGILAAVFWRIGMVNAFIGNVMTFVASFQFVITLLILIFACIFRSKEKKIQQK